MESQSEWKPAWASLTNQTNRKGMQYMHNSNMISNGVNNIHFATHKVLLLSIDIE